MNNKTIKSVLIIANGKAPKKELFQNLVNKSDLIIAADGGANICFQHDIKPEYVVGDFDSIENNLRTHFNTSEFIHKPDQNEHDLLKALKFCETLNPQQVICTAVFGKRIDHVLSNLFIIQNQNFKFKLEFIDDYAKVFIIKNTYQFFSPPNQHISFLSYRPVFGVTLKGFKYNLTEKDFPDGFNGLSNEIDENPASVSIKNGSLITIVING